MLCCSISLSHKSTASRNSTSAIETGAQIAALISSQNLHLDKSYFFTIIAGISESPPHESSASLRWPDN